MQAVILCGGKGIRLRPKSIDLPKPMVPVGKNPILEHVVKIYRHYGVRDFIFSLGYKSDVIKRYFRKKQKSALADVDCGCLFGMSIGLNAKFQRITDRMADITALFLEDPFWGRLLFLSHQYSIRLWIGVSPSFSLPLRKASSIIKAKPIV